MGLHPLSFPAGGLMTIQDKPTRRRSKPNPPTTPDPVEIAMEIQASGKAPTGEAAALLRRQAILIDEQIGLARNERFRNRIRSIRDIAIAAMVVALVVALGAVVWSASRTTGLVIQPFTVPPALTEEGLDGRAVAALFQDELVRLDTVTQSARPTASFRNDWSEAITVEVEAGGLSLTDAYTSLTRSLGKETYVSGGMRQTTSGLELVVRSSDGTAITVRGPADQPEALMRQAAERVYEQTQPYRYATYLAATADALPTGPEREALIDRARRIFTTLVSSPSETERLWGYNGLARVDSSSARDALAILQSALEIDPQHPLILLNTASLRLVLGQDEVAMRVAQRAASSFSRRDNLVKLNSDRRDSFPLIVEAQLADLEGDWLRALEIRTRNASRVKSPLAWRGVRRDRVDTLIALHQPSAALRLNNESRLVDKDISNARSGTRALYLPDAEAAASLDQWPQVVAALQAWEIETTPTLPMRFRDARSTLLWPKLAYARARTGDLAGAQALIAATPLDCYLCVRERARIAELAGDRAAADRWSAEARRQGPSLPFAFAERGQMLMARGDIAGAIAFYEQAVERGPRWADPQKFWGDALMAQGDAAGAIRKYRAAAERAPRWGALHLAWGRALEAQGRREQAREKYTEAARMDLSAADRAEVVRRLGVRTQR
jgi:tetratricopeptide (TPR) repeat protein